MRFRFARCGRVILPLLIAVLLATAVAIAAHAQTPAISTSAFDAARATLDRVEQATQREGLSEEAYADLKRQLMPLRDELRDRIEALEPELAQAVTRLNQLGDKPAAGAAAEDAAITAERARLGGNRAEIEAALKQARLLALRADQVSERINERRRVLFARELFTRSAGLLDPVFWRTAVDAATEEVAALPTCWPTGGIMCAATADMPASPALSRPCWRWSSGRRCCGDGGCGASPSRRSTRGLAALSPP